MARNGGRAVVAMIAALVVASACGSEDDAGADPTAPPEPAGATTVAALDTAATTVGDESDPTSASAAPASAPATSDVGSTVAAGGAPSDACAAMANVDLEALLGEPADEPVAERSDFGDACEVGALDPASSGRIVLRATSDSAATNFENMREQFGANGDLEGLGDEAFSAPGMVVVRTGDRLLSLQVVRWRDLDTGGVPDEVLLTAMTAVVGSGEDGGDGESTPSTGDEGAMPAAGLACELLGGVDLAAMIGEPMGALVSEEQGGSDVCTARPIDPSSDAVASLTLLDGDVAQRLAESREMFGVDAVVEGIGDEGFHSGPVLAVRAGTQGFLLYVLGDISRGADVDDAALESAMVQFLAATD